MSSLWQKFVNIDYRKHLLFSLAIRVLLISYGIHHDEVSEVNYTDIDYKVFTDASRHLINGNSPYDRHTYRYTPLVALLLVPNILIHHSFGKVLFSLVDILVAVLIKLLVENMLIEYDNYAKEKNKPASKKKKRYKNPKPVARSVTEMESLTNTAMLSWLYNPLTIAISTRGNCDSLAGLLVLSTLYFLECKKRYFTAGLIHGVSIHFRLYPLLYSLSFFMYLSNFSFYSATDRKKQANPVKSIEDSSNKLQNIENKIMESSSLGGHNIVSYDKSVEEKKTIFKKAYLLYLIPNIDQIRFVAGCLISIVTLTWGFYVCFGYKFLYETYIYHLIRTDFKHNFSLYFYLMYLTAWVKNIGIWQKVLIVLPQLVLILVFSIRYGLNKFSINFSILVQTIVMVSYNRVLTSQYFVWIMTVLPLCLWQIDIKPRKALVFSVVWIVAQLVWLLPAYLLEFHGENTFLFIWIQSVSFFCANITILGRMIKYFQPVAEKVN